MYDGRAAGLGVLALLTLTAVVAQRAEVLRQGDAVTAEARAIAYLSVRSLVGGRSTPVIRATTTATPRAR